MPRPASKLNPKSQAVKQLEMSVRRVMKMIAEWDKNDDAFDNAISPGTGFFRRIDLPYRQYRAQIEAAFEAYKDGNLHRQAWSIYLGLPKENQDSIKKDVGELTVRKVKKAAEGLKR